MTALHLLRRELARIGYSAIVSDYVFPDVFVSPPCDRMVPLAAFTNTPPSYRNAAFAAIEAKNGAAPEIETYRALGAPLLFAIEDQEVEVWQIRPTASPTIRHRTKLDRLNSLFSEQRNLWTPDRIHRAKSFGGISDSYQLDFVDTGLLTAIESEIHHKLDRLLNETLSEAVQLRIIRPGEQIDDQILFRTVFRLLAAKVLQDRGHEVAKLWDSTDIDTVLQGISGYYRLPQLLGEQRSFRGTVFDSAWNRLRAGINFQNISSDELAFVYEHTLVTEETRQHFGTHSTPRSVAEYVVGRVMTRPDETAGVSVYEPFAGAGVFMVAALRYLGDLLPIELTPRQRHDVLVRRLRGDEIDPFAAEVARLSLILADYPNENGWAISEIDLFSDNNLFRRTRSADIVLCNPPFEKFTPAERRRWAEAVARSPRKPIAVLESVLDAQPHAVGFVLPETFINGAHYRAQRIKVEQLYKDIEIVSLPDRMFKASDVRSSLLIASERRFSGDASTVLRSTVVKGRDRERFRRTGQVSSSRIASRRSDEKPGDLWINELAPVWDALSDLPKLRDFADIHRGIEWRGNQASAVRRSPEDGFRPGIHSASAVRVFALDEHVYLDCRPERLRGGAIDYPWSKPKLLANAARVSRGPWCFAAALDLNGLIGSQQLFGIWPKESPAAPSLHALCALVNSPVAIAYIASHSPPDRIRVGHVSTIPMPRGLPLELDELAHLYAGILHEHRGMFSRDLDANAAAVLQEIDAAILRAYDLSPRLERNVLEYFRGERRPTVHAWTHWFPEDFQPFIPLYRYISGEYKVATSGWALKVFKPLPDDEAAALRDYMD